MAWTSMDGNGRQCQPTKDGGDLHENTKGKTSRDDDDDDDNDINGDDDAS